MPIGNIVTLGELLRSRTTKVPEYIGNNILNPKSKLCIFGEEKMFKSLLAQTTAYCLLTGQDWMGLPTAQVPRVLYIQAEIAPGLLKARLEKTYAYLNQIVYKTKWPNNINPINGLQVSHSPRFYLDRLQDYRALEKYVSVFKPFVLIIDPIYKMIQSEDQSSYMKCFEYMDDLADKYGCAIIAVHHTAKPGLDYKGQEVHHSKPRGSLAVAAYYDSLIHIYGDKETDDRSLSFQLRNAELPQPTIDIHLNRDVIWFDTF